MATYDTPFHRALYEANTWPNPQHIDPREGHTMFGKKDTRIDDAIRQREQHDLPHVKSVAPEAAHVSGLESIRFCNIKEQLKDAPSLATITKATISPVFESPEQVIKLRSVDGQTFSLWVMPDGTVRTITPY